MPIGRRDEHLHAGRTDERGAAAANTAVLPRVVMSTCMLGEGGCAYHAVLRHARLFEQVRGDAGGGDEAARIELHLDPLAKSGRVAVTYRLGVSDRFEERVGLNDALLHVPDEGGNQHALRCTPPRVLGTRRIGGDR